MKLPTLGLGTVAFGRDWGLKYPQRTHRTSLPTDSELDRLLSVAEELGVTLLDTAPAYGSSEERLGTLLRGRSHSFVISTKAGETSTPQGSTFDFRPSTLRASVERSLERLYVDVLDFVFLHAGPDDSEALGGLETLLRLRDEGKVRWVGASTKSVQGGLRAVETCDAVMLTYNHQDRSQEEVLDKAGGQTKVLIKKPLASGHVGAPDEALRFVAEHPAVDSVVVGTTNVEHLRANARAINSVSCENSTRS